MDASDPDSTNKLLKVIVALLLQRKDKETRPLRQQIEILAGLKLRPKDIAEILGREQSYVNKELAGIRKAKK